jgi:hypothetical protein
VDFAELANFAKIYGVTVSFLRYGQRMEDALAIDSHMRRQKTTKATRWRRLEARLNMYRLHVSLLFEEVSLRSTNIIATFDPEGTHPTAAALITRAQYELPAERAELAQEIGTRMRERGLNDDEIADMAGFAPGAKANPFLVQPKRLHAV